MVVQDKTVTYLADTWWQLKIDYLLELKSKPSNKKCTHRQITFCTDVGLDIGFPWIASSLC